MYVVVNDSCGASVLSHTGSDNVAPLGTSHSLPCGNYCPTAVCSVFFPTGASSKPMAEFGVVFRNLSKSDYYIHVVYEIADIQGF